MQRKIIEKHTHNHWDFDRIIIISLVFLLVIIMLGWVGASLREPGVVYGKCVNSCSEKHFSGIQIGQDRPVPVILSSTGKNSFASYRLPYVKEFDRTNCIQSCNIMYIKLKQ